MKILEIIRSLELPNNPLDDIIDQVHLAIHVTVFYYILKFSPLIEFITLQLGGPDNVAEITGRRGMLVRASGGKGVTYQARNT